MRINPRTRDRLSLRFPTKSFALLLTLAMTFISVAQVPTTDIFLKLGADAGLLPGESSDTVFSGVNGWNDVSNFHWAVTADTSWIRRGGASVAKAVPQSLELTRRIDSASPGILSCILTGRVVGTGELVVRGKGQTAKDPTDVVLRYEFTGIYFTSVKPAVMAGDSETMETISFVFKTIKMTYRPRDRQGQPGEAITVTWDIPAGTVSPP